MSGLSRAHFSSQLVMSNRGGRRLSSPQGPSPVHHAHHSRHYTHGGFSQPTDYVYGGGIGYYNGGLPYPHDQTGHTHSHSRPRGSSSHGRSTGRHDQIPEESAANFDRGFSRQRSTDTSTSSGRRPGTHSRKTSAPGSYMSGQYHEPTLMSSGVDRFALTQPENDAFGPAPVRHTVTSKHPLPHTLSEKYSMSQVDSEIADRGVYGRFSPTRPAAYTSGGYQSRALFSNKAMASNGSIAGDSAYASGLSNQSGSTRSPVDMEETTPKYGGMGMRPEERSSAHSGCRALSKSSLSGSRESSQGNLHHGSSAASRSSLTGSRDSAHFGRRFSGEEEGLVDWEVSNVRVYINCRLHCYFIVIVTQTLLPLEQKRQRVRTII